MRSRRKLRVDGSSSHAVPLSSGFSSAELARVVGHAEVYVGDDHLATVGPRSPIGEMALVEHAPRTATATACAVMDLVSFDVKHLRSLLEEMPSARQRLVDLVEERAALLQNHGDASAAEENA